MAESGMLPPSLPGSILGAQRSLLPLLPLPSPNPCFALCPEQNTTARLEELSKPISKDDLAERINNRLERLAAPVVREPNLYRADPEKKGEAWRREKLKAKGLLPERRPEQPDEFAGGSPSGQAQKWGGILGRMGRGGKGSRSGHPRGNTLEGGSSEDRTGDLHGMKKDGMRLEDEGHPPTIFESSEAEDAGRQHGLSAYAGQDVSLESRLFQAAKSIKANRLCTSPQVHVSPLIGSDPPLVCPTAGV